MTERKLGRREFLKLAIAAAGAAGLSHFRILNIGGADVALAQENCSSDPGGIDICTPQTGDRDVCPEGVADPANDICDPAIDEADVCIPGTPVNQPDNCTNDEDVCDPTDVPPDSCSVTTDMCEVPQAPDTCVPPSDPDTCAPAGGDYCITSPPDTTGDGDVCIQPGFGDYCEATGAADTCVGPAGPQTPDICDPGTVDPDTPNPVTVDSVGVETVSSALPALGGMVAALGAAALWVRHRLRPQKSE